MATALQGNKGGAATGGQKMLYGSVLHAVKQSKMSYIWEYKLKNYQENSLYKTADWFSLNTRTIRR